MSASNELEVWVVDNDQSVRWVLEKALRQAHMRTRSFERGEHLLDAIENEKPDVLITDVRMPGLDGLALLERLSRTCPDLPVIVVTAHTDLENAVAAYQGGAFEYLPKPFDVDEVIELVRKAARQVGHVPGKDTTSDTARMPSLIGQAPAMQEVFRSIGRLARSSMTVLITGESGTGKELVARALHQHSPRAEKSFVALNTSAIASELLESELFGHERGAFTGADQRRIGRFEQANGGTLLLDEIAETSQATQAKLLRVLQDQEFYRLGGTTVQKTSARIIAATNRKLSEALRDGSLREDLYYRINVIEIHLQPLRERREDIKALAERYRERFSLELGRHCTGFTGAALSRMEAYSWPGNVRELRNAVERAVLLCKGSQIDVADVHLESHGPRGGDSEWQIKLPPDGLSLHTVERALVLAALQRTGFVQKDAAQLIGVSKRKLNYMIQRMGLVHPSWRRNREDPDPIPN